MTQERKPDWEWWGNVDEVTVIEAVALSMDIDPNKLHYRKPPGTMGEVEVRDESPEFDKRFSLAIRNLKVLEAWGIGGVVGKLEYCLVKLVKFTAVALSWNWKIPAEMAALAEPDKRDAKILDLRHQVGQKQSEAAIERHSKLRERTLAAVLATIATADRKDYTNKSDQKIVVTKLAGLVEDTRANYEKDAPGGKILSLQGIEDLIRNILNGKYFS